MYDSAMDNSPRMSVLFMAVPEEKDATRDARGAAYYAVSVLAERGIAPDMTLHQAKDAIASTKAIMQQFIKDNLILYGDMLFLWPKPNLEV